jgi:hypothetical protein
MHIYVDESGSFSIPSDRQAPSIGCAGALIIPEARHSEVTAGFETLSAP